MNQTFKKFAAGSLAAILSMTAMPALASAESFTSMEQAAFSEAISDFTAQYARSFQEFDSLQSGLHEDITLTLDEAGRSLLGLLATDDISWFHDLRLSADFSMEESAQYLTAGVYLNDTRICTLEYFFNLEKMEIYLRIPELRPEYIRVDYEEALRKQQQALKEQQEALENSEDEIDEATLEALESLEEDALSDPAFFKNYMAVIGSLPKYLPDPSVAEKLLNKYSALVFDSITDGQVQESSYHYNGEDVPCTVYEGILSQKDAQQMMATLVQTAREDKQLKDILTGLDQGLQGEESIYESFMDSLEDAEEDLNNTLSDDNTSMVASVSVDQDGTAVARSLFIQEEEETIPIYEWEKNTDGNLVFSSLNLAGYEEGFTLYGNGVMDGALLSGDYHLSVGGMDLLDIEVIDYDTSAMEKGQWYGSYRTSISPAVLMDESGEVNPLQNFSFLLNVASDRDTGKLSCSLESAGAALATLTAEAKLGVTVEKPDFEDFTDVYDSTDQAAMDQYMAEASLDTVIGNMTSAGMPEELARQLFSETASQQEAAP